MVKTNRFTCNERVKRTEEIQNLFKNGNRVSIQGAKLFYLSNNLENNRIAFALPRGYGNAVQRNHCKRISREAYRDIKKHLNTGFDMILLIYPGNTSFSSRCNTIRMLTEKAGILKK